jgi:rubrerythrin
MPAFQNAFSVLKNDRKLTKEELIRSIRLMIAAEYEAVQLYIQLAESIDDEVAIKVLKEIADEELVHAGEFLKLVDYLNPKEKEFYKEGEQEVEEVIFKNAGDALQHLSNITKKNVVILKKGNINHE